MARKKKKLPEPIGGGWYLLPDGAKVRGRRRAYETAGLDPDAHGNRRSDAARQRNRKMPIADRRLRVAALLKSKVPLREIASAVGASLGTVQQDATLILAEWRAEATRDVADYVVEELATLREDEYRLRLRYQSAATERERMMIYDRIRGVMRDRREIIGLQAPEVRRVIIQTDEIEEGVVFRAGGSKEEYLRALQAAQGMLPADARTLRVAK